MTVYACDVCAESFLDRTNSKDKPSRERLFDHMLDEHRDYLINGKMLGLSPDAYELRKDHLPQHDHDDGGCTCGCPVEGCLPCGGKATE